MRERWNRFAVVWCRAFHGEAMQPKKGHYLCRTCKRAYPVPWQEGEEYLERVTSASRNRGFAVYEYQRN
jgi:hypothetical protein